MGHGHRHTSGSRTRPIASGSGARMPKPFAACANSREHATVAWRPDSGQRRNHRRSGRKPWRVPIAGCPRFPPLIFATPSPASCRPDQRCAGGEPDEGAGRSARSAGRRKSSENLLKTKRLAVLSGPSHAEEVARGLPTSVVVASADRELAERTQQHFGTDRFRVYTNPDLLGVELAGALKNVVGIAAGVCDGLGFGDNAKAALLTRGMVEMTRFGVSLGAAADTFAGLAGIGDLITTCFSPHGRNRRVGLPARPGGIDREHAGRAAGGRGRVHQPQRLRTCRRAGTSKTPIMTGVYQMVHEGQAAAGRRAGPDDAAAEG